ncbi:MAG: UDP-3-O-(3-hydroxymyristoyl)glucosamine N-acyltransferase [Chthoniobacterales bacterium]|nr:UDP-3-O-(3-hydroxymyristoyl)glucosamine N-acyltransferase [Chthoniobacterales bacterium]
MRLDELAKLINAEVIGEGSIKITSASTLDDARAGQISFLANAKYATSLETTQASAVIVAPSVQVRTSAALLRTPEPYYAFTRAMIALHGYRKHPFAGVHPRAFVDESATIGEKTIVYPGAFIGPRVKIGRDCIIYANVSIYDDCRLGDRVTIHSGTVIGVDGFGYATVHGEHTKIPQIGNVVIEDDVEIGANCTIDRATLGSTVIGSGTKTSNIIAVGHNTKVGPGGLIVALVGIAGSTTIGHHVTIGGQAGVAGHLKIGDNVTIAGQSGVTSNIPDQRTVMGMPAMPVHHGRRVLALFTQLPEIIERVKTLEQQVEELSNTDGGAEVV